MHARFIGQLASPLGLMISIVASLVALLVYFEKVLKGSPMAWTRNVHLALFSVATVGLQVFGDFGEACPHSLIGT